jgi:hypothetical protein
MGGGHPEDRLPWIATALHGTSLRVLLETQARPPAPEAAVLAMDMLYGSPRYTAPDSCTAISSPATSSFETAVPSWAISV